MKAAFVLCIAAVSAMLVYGGTDVKVPDLSCPKGEHHVVCPDTEPTCDNPTPAPKPRPEHCVCVSCQCDSPTVRDTKINKCVYLTDCS